MKTSIFISYSHQDAAEVRKIAESIQSAGIAEVWYDTKLRGGENYFSVIANQIIACEYLIFIVSDHSIQSDWCLRELEFAASEQKKILAVWLKDVDISPRVRLIIQSTQYINFDSSHMDAFSHAIMLALDQGRPKEMTLTDLIRTSGKYLSPSRGGRISPVTVSPLLSALTLICCWET